MFLSYKGFLPIPDLAFEIVKFLDPKDIPAISKGWRINWDKLLPYYKDAIRRKIDCWFRNYFGPRYPEFRQCMIDDKAVISGSFILQMILGEKWNMSDIDIVVPHGNRTGNNDLEITFGGVKTFLYCTKGTVAAVNGHLETVKLLLSDHRVDPSDNNNLALSASVINNYNEITKVLLHDPRVTDGCLVGNEFPIPRRMIKERNDKRYLLAWMGKTMGQGWLDAMPYVYDRLDFE